MRKKYAIKGGKMKTIVVNLLGGAGAGKSTTAALVFGQLKKKGINCELVTEYAKEVVYEENMKRLQNQLYIFSKQYYSMDMIRDKVNVIITDSPLLLSMHYNRNFSDSNFLRVPDEIFDKLVLYCYTTFDNLNFYIERNHEYKQEGRYQDEARAKQEDAIIRSLIDGLKIDCEHLLSTDDCVGKIVKAVEERCEYYKNLYKSGLEVERKFLIETLPSDIDNFKKDFIFQGYLIRNEKEIRIRNVSNQHYFLTEKYGRGMIREEYEKELTREEFLKLLKKVDKKVVEKTRYYYPLEDGRLAELDLYFGANKGLITAEVEFETAEEAKKFVPPAWFGQDVTEDESYKNLSLAKKSSRTQSSLNNETSRIVG